MSPHLIIKYFGKKPTELLVKNTFLSKIMYRLIFKQVANNNLISTLIKILF